LVDPCDKTRRELGAQWNIPTFASVKDCRADFQAAIVATPTRNHFEIARALLLRGKHLLIEKPLTLSTRDSQVLVDLSARHRRVVQVGHVERFNPVYQEARGQMDHVRYLELHRASRFTGRSTDVGVVLDLMIHDIDLMLNMVPADVQRVEAVGISVFGDHEDLAQARITFANGAVANLWASRCSMQPQRTLKFVGTNGFVQADLTSRKVTTVAVPEDVQSKRVVFNRLSPEGKQRLIDHLFDEVLPQRDYEVAGCNPLLNEQADFLDAVETGQKNQVPAEDGHRAVVVANQILAAIKSHAWTEDSFGPRGALVGIDQFVSAQQQRRVA
jgi:predicted dehydrogenase